jgi:RNA polymerase sigma factor (sigma-70 family)
VEASAFHHPGVARRALGTPLLRLRSDEQLIALFREGNEEAFTVIHDRYRQRLFAYTRQMLSSASRADAEDVLQDVFVRAYGALRTDSRHVNLRAWLYRVAHNRCIDHLRRPTPPPNEIYELSRTPLLDPIETAQRRDDLRRLVEDVGRLPAQQRSALLMREIDGLAYADIATALDVTVAAVKSLLVRARVGLVEAIQARDTDCAVIRSDLLDAYDRGVKASGRSRRHMRECSGCRDYKVALRTLKRSFAALSPVGALGPLALVAKALGIGGASGGGGAAVGLSGAGVATGVTAGKVCVVVCTAALATGGAVEVHHLAAPAKDKPKHERVVTSAPAPAPTRSHAPTTVTPSTIRHRVDSAPVLPLVLADPKAAPAGDETVATDETTALAPTTEPEAAPVSPAATAVPDTSGGSTAPEEQTATTTPPSPDPAPSQPTTTTPSSGSAAPAVTAAPEAPPAGTSADPPPADGPPPAH